MAQWPPVDVPPCSRWSIRRRAGCRASAGCSVARASPRSWAFGRSRRDTPIGRRRSWSIATRRAGGSRWLAKVPAGKDRDVRSISRDRRGTSTPCRVRSESPQPRAAPLAPVLTSRASSPAPPGTRPDDAPAPRLFLLTCDAYAPSSIPLPLVDPAPQGDSRARQSLFLPL